MTNHTPGPWKARHYSVVEGRVSELVIDGPDWAEMAVVYCQEEDGDILGDGEKNAWLMAAAPELLEACEAVIGTVGRVHAADCIVDSLLGKGCICHVNKLRAAIAKARGER